MSNQEKFTTDMTQGYTFSGQSIVLGGAVLGGECIKNLHVRVPLRTMNRHGLIAGATGPGKTKTLQMLSEQLASAGTPVLLMDIKGDLSGIAMAGTTNPKITERHQKIGIAHTLHGNQVEFLTLSDEKGARLRATVTEFGPVLFSKILGLNDTQSGVVAIIFKYCDDQQLPLIDIKDFKKTLQFIANEGKDSIQAEYGLVSPSTVGSIMRKVVELEQQGAEIFFGERSFEVDDLCRFDDQGRGIISILRLTDIQAKPKLFSTFMLQMLAEIYATFPEEGDIEQPKLCIFIDEAHLVFAEASKALMDQIEAIIKLIRSKGIGVYFITQNPADIPDSVLGQLGLKIQHALRAFTAKDRKDIKLAAQNYPITAHYDVETLITELGIGEAFVTVLSEKGTPTPLVHTMMCSPASRMDILTADEIDDIISTSGIARKYNEIIDRESAYEILGGKIQVAQAAEQQAEMAKQQAKAEKTTAAARPAKAEKSMVEQVLTSAPARQVGRTLARELTRGLLGVLGIGGKRKLW